jgi:hypothetical protein
LLALFAVGCGGDDNDNEASDEPSQAQSEPAGESEESEEAEEAEGAKTECKKPATTDETGLPAAFPIPGELTITEVRKDGPTNVIDGYWSSDLAEAYPEYKEIVEQSGYKILFSEQEEHDAEISYSGSGRTGLIAFRDDCKEAETLRVHITNRPG